MLIADVILFGSFIFYLSRKTYTDTVETVETKKQQIYSDFLSSRLTCRSESR